MCCQNSLPEFIQGMTSMTTNPINQHLSEKYFDGKTKEFYELKMGQLIIEEYVNKFLELLRYVPYIKDEKVKVKQFVSGLPQTYQNKIEFDEPNTLEDTIQKAMYYYEQFGSQT
jgi:hypothetical protein